MFGALGLQLQAAQPVPCFLQQAHTGRFALHDHILPMGSEAAGPSLV
jgi:hypothetical protein